MSLSLRKGTPEERVDELFHILKTNGNAVYLDFDVTLYEHCLLMATVAEASPYRPQSVSKEELVVAALLHDIGRYPRVMNLMKQMSSLQGVSQWGHERIGMEYLHYLGFNPQVCQLVNAHIQAKRYLAKTKSNYINSLPYESRDELYNEQGGPMSWEEAENFRSSVIFEDCLELRRWDDLATSYDAARRAFRLESHRSKVLSTIV